ncbi:MAG: transcriptional regulator [Denitrovibrio sp.]|nr:MAG: transcriptional regulator [Denitrovibrio sp.]
MVLIMKRNEDKLSPKSKSILKKLGTNIKTARKRRKLSIDEMASRMFVSRQTLIRLEAGNHGVSLNVLLNALLVLGLESELGMIASPDNDTLGKALEIQNLPGKVKKKTKPDLDF